LPEQWATAISLSLFGVVLQESHLASAGASAAALADDFLWQVALG
jgi:hypothetical protein